MSKTFFENLKVSSPLQTILGISVLSTFNKDSRKYNNNILEGLSSVDGLKKRRPNFNKLDKLKKTGTLESFNAFNYKYSLGFFSGCHKFSFRVTFKEYKIGLKPTKFSLLLNQFRLDLDLFIGLIQEVLVNNFPLDFYENFFSENINEVDFKIHFLVILRRRHLTQTGTKFFIVPKGCFLIYLRKQLWYTIFMDFIYIYSSLKYYKGFKKYLSVIFLLVLFYTYTLIHKKLTKVVNKCKVYDLEDRMYASLGNVFVLKFYSFKLYRKMDLRLLRHSYFFSSRCLNTFIDTDFFDDKNQLIELDKINSREFILSNSINWLDSIDEI